MISWGVRTDVGSSIINKLGFCIKHLIISTLCFSPTDNSLTNFKGSTNNSHSFDNFDISSTTFLNLILLSSAIKIFSATVRAGKREKCWKSIPIPFLRAMLGDDIEIYCLLISIDPLSGWSTP